jgi:hypothetical protein
LSRELWKTKGHFTKPTVGVVDGVIEQNDAVFVRLESEVSHAKENGF